MLRCSSCSNKINVYVNTGQYWFNTFIMLHRHKGNWGIYKVTLNANHFNLILLLKILFLLNVPFQLVLLLNNIFLTGCSISISLTVK